MATPGKEKGLARNDKNEELIVKVGFEPKSPNLSFCTVPSHITSDEQSPRISLGRGEYRQALQKIAPPLPPQRAKGSKLIFLKPFVTGLPPSH